MLTDQRHTLNDEFDVLVKKLEMKYAQKKKPLQKLQQEIVSGEITD